MKLFTYENADGSFNYELYRGIQQAGNIRKIDNVWAHEPAIMFLAHYVKKELPRPRLGLCHGTRRGDEQKWFREAIPGCDVVGTEISETALQFPNTIQWDFHETKPEWLNSVDFIYSNSWDHTYDPARCFTAWGSCLRPGGLMLLEHTKFHTPRGANELDPFGIDLDEFVMMLDDIGKQAEFRVRETISTFPFEVPSRLARLAYVIVQRKV